jgi:hypothetical protein
MMMSVSILLSSGSFFLDNYLTEKLQKNHYSEDELTYALNLQLDAAYQIKLAQHAFGTDLWLKYAKKIAKSDGEISKKLAEHYFHQGQIDTSILWYRQAIKFLDSSAILPLAKLYFRSDQLELARKILASDKSQLLANLPLAIEVAIAQGDLIFIAKNLHRLSASKIGKTLLAKIKQYKILSGINETNNEQRYISNELQSATLIPIQKKSCRIRLQLFATTLDDLYKLSQFKKQFSQHPLNEYICLNEPKYVQFDQLNCDNDKTNAIKCDEDVWQMLTKNFESRYIGLLYPDGGANVHSGIMYFDRNDTFDIFSHEITHLLGFVDEYPLVEEHPKCQQIQTTKFAHNIVVLPKIHYGEKTNVRREILKNIPWAKQIKYSTPILTRILTSTNNPIANKYKWLIGTPQKYEGEFGVFNADTCNSSDFQSFKPLGVMTQLEYSEIQFPKQYVALLESNRHKYLMPSFHYNVALSLLLKGDLKQGRAWLLKSASLENNNGRKTKILQAKF